VDVASGVESRPGLKDPEKMRRFIARVRETVEGLHQE
jgi:phosphoribosylanthranilate isomerase